MTDHRVVAVILAAGRGTRLGGPKLVATLHGRTFGEWIRRTLDEVGVAAVWVVRHPGDSAGLGGSEVVNPLEDGDMFSSVRAGIMAVDAEWYLVWPVDVPAVSASTVRALLERAGWAMAVQPVHGGRRGHPYLIHRRLASLALTTGRRTMREVFGMGMPVAFVETRDRGVVFNINTPEDLQGLERWLRR